jgi:class 3 adenylate cyclase
MSQRACASCGTANESDARFCEGCGTVLERTCAACGVAASATARFCRACGAALDEKPATSQSGPTRKTVTVLFADLAGSTAFEEIVDVETAREVIGRYHELLRSTADRHRAGVTKYIGDGFMAVWGVPEIGADDAEHAVEAAVELQERFVALASRVAEAHGVDLALRVAVNTGEVVVGADDADLVGDALNVGARLESECPHGHVVVGEETWRSTRGRHRYDPLGAIQVKGRIAPVPVYQWLGHRSETADSVPFVGRSDELARLRRVFDDAVASRTARLVTVTGDPGVGKTRLAAEFVRALDGAQVVRARCALEGSPALVPLVEMLRTRDIEADIPVGVPERDRILRDLTGMTAGVAGSVEETFWALRRFIEVLASDGPVVVIVDDIHWADALLIDLIEHLAEWVQDAPVLVVALARPELRETRPDLVTVGGWVSEALRLRGLEARATAELAAHVLGSDQLPPELLGRLPSSTGGNPLFVRELVGMLVHDGVLVATPDGWQLTVDVDGIAVPPTIQALLASRLERLNAADRRVLEVASVVGTDFSLSAVAALADQGSAEITSALNRLRRLDLVQPTGTYAGDEPVWRFHHVLIRDVAYRRLLKSDRAELHERLADWVQGRAANAAFQSDEVIARHLEAAHGYRLDLGLRDEHTGELALRSAQNYLASARRALDRDELVSAGTQAARGATLASGDSALRAELLLVGCEALLSAGDVAAGSPLVDDLEQIAGEALTPWAICYRCQLVVYTDPTRLPEVDERLQDAIDEFARRKDAGGLAKAHRVRANARARLGRVGDCESDLFEALIAARQGGDHRQITAALGAAPNAALWGPSPAPKAGGRCLDVVRMQRMTTAAPSLEATSLRCLAVLELLRGRPDKARTMLADARQVVADLGLRHGLMETELFAGIIELMVGDPVAAEPHFRTALEGLDALGVGADAGQAAALLARSVLAQGRVDEADRYAAQSERIAGHNLKTAIAWRAVRAEILAAQGQLEAAIAQARDAVAVAADTDLVLDHADACLALSRVLAAAGDERAASEARRNAESLYAAKDAAFMIGQTTQPVDPPSMPSADVADARTKVSNRATRIAEVGWRGMLAHDADAVVSAYSDRVIYDDHRRLSGDPIEGFDQLREAARRNFAQYPHVEWGSLAVRGETLDLSWARWWDDAGNESMTLHLYQVGDDDLIEYHGRFDDDDFEGAYRELERRYYAGEGAPFAENGRGTCAWLEAMWRRDVEAARRVKWPDFRWVASPSALKPAERSVDEFFEWLDERTQQLSSLRVWAATMQWLSPNCYISLSEIQGAGADGEEYRWNRIYVGDYRDGLASSVHEFDVADEDAAFAYAESLVAQRPSRLVVSNAASRLTDRVLEALQANDASAVTVPSSPRIIYEDRRALAGALVSGFDYLSETITALLSQYNHFEGHTLAVRGDRLCLMWSRWSDDTGNEATNLHLAELGEDGLVARLLYFDEADFWVAYREMEVRYYAGEGAAYAENGLASAEWVIAISNADIEGVRRTSHHEFRYIATPSALKDAERTVDDMFRWMEERGRQVASQRHWVPVLHWLSPDCAVGLGEIAAVGADGEDYDWNFIYVAECRDGLLATVREFDDEDEAFTYAESLVAGQPSRLSLSNRATQAAHRLVAAAEDGDFDSVAEIYADQFTYGDHRRLSGEPITDRVGLRAAWERIARLYSRFEARTRAVRGERLHLTHCRWSDDSGNQSAGFVVSETGDDGRIVYEDRFDEEDFEAAYAELDRRYYAGEGAAYAEAGAALTELILAESRGDLESAFSMFSTPGLRIESRSRSLFPSRSAEELRRSVEELGAMVQSYRVWGPAACWLSDEWTVSRHEREAVGRDGEKYSWARIYVAQIKDGLFTSLCEFDVDEEDAAFAYAEEQMRKASSKLMVTNRAAELGKRVLATMRAHDVDGTSEHWADRFVYDDRRRISGELISDQIGLRSAFRRVFQQYNGFESHILAVRGERLSLSWNCWSDAVGNQTSTFILAEIGHDERVVYEARFDEDDFAGAYRELERRYYTGEGAEFAENGYQSVSFLAAMDALDVEAARRMCLPEFSFVTPPTTLTPDERTLDEFFQWLGQRATQVSSINNFCSVVRWLSPTCFVARGDVQATGADGEQYAWAWIYVGEFHDGLLATMRQFDDEEAAFAYAEERIRGAPIRLAVSNRASAVESRVLEAMLAHDLDGTVKHWADQFVYDDRRRYSGDPLNDRAGVRLAMQRIFQQYNRFESRVLAVRGEFLNLASHCWSDDTGNQTSSFILAEVDHDDRIVYEGRFDEDDFPEAYRELENRYYAGEGAAFGTNGWTLVNFLEAMNALDVEAARRMCQRTCRWLSPPSTLTTQERSLDEFFRWLGERAKQVSSVNNFFSAIHWVSPTCYVGRGDVLAVGADGEEYTWARIYVGEFHNGLMSSVHQFESDEQAAFGYAEERMYATASRLAVSNPTTDAARRVNAALGAGDVSAVLSSTSDDYVIDDRRRFAGELLRGHESLRAGTERVLQQFSAFEMRALAVRGEHHALCLSRWSDDSGNESTHLHVFELGDHGRLACEVRFDEDDFEDAYRELENRYYAGEGAAFGEPGLAITEYITVKNRGDLDTLFRDLSTPDVHIESRSRSVFLDRSAAEYRASLEELANLVGSVHEWLVSIRWLSQRWFAARIHREALGKDGEEYEWTRIVVGEIWGQRLASVCQFDLEEADAAFDYAEEQVRATVSPLAVTNRSSKMGASVLKAMQAGDADTVLAHFTNDYVFDDRRRLSGDPISGKAELRPAIDRILQQFSNFESRVLAVRGERLQLGWSRWSDTAGNETRYLHVYALDDDSLIARDIRFDEDDFDGAYRELETRYYAGESAHFAEYGLLTADYVAAMNRGDFETVFGELTDAELELDNRSRSAFPNRSAAEVRAALEELNTMVTSVRSWFSAIRWLPSQCMVVRMEREAVGHDGEHYAWARILVGRWQNAKLTSLVDFDAEDEDAALAYGEELARQT